MPVRATKKFSVAIKELLCDSFSDKKLPYSKERMVVPAEILI
ncbi:MAG: hypothetical protein V1779_11390 [bacterium]